MRITTYVKTKEVCVSRSCCGSPEPFWKSRVCLGGNVSERKAEIFPSVQVGTRFLRALKFQAKLFVLYFVVRGQPFWGFNHKPAMIRLIRNDKSGFVWGKDQNRKKKEGTGK